MIKQRLIVEGHDAIALSTICKLKGLPAPRGYTDEKKYKAEFIQVAGGYSKVNAALGQLLIDTSVQNIGVIVDANNEGPQKRWETLKSQLAHVFPHHLLSSIAPNANGIVVKEDGLPTVGIWIMPDNLANGYLEHFLAALISMEDKNYAHADKIIDDLMALDHCRFTQNKKQKALLHTWLSWQKEPGKPFGAAVQAGYFNINAPNVQPFLHWFSQTFSLEKD